MKIANRLTDRRVLLLLAAGLAVAASIVVWRFTWGAAAITHLDLVTDLRDDRKLAGIADNVFIGRVKEKLWEITLHGTPKTYFSVEVLESLKGSMPAVVKIRDDGSTTVENSGVWIFHDDLVLPQPGKSYMFATLHNEEKDVHVVASGGYGRVEIAGSESLNAQEVLTSEPANELRTRFADAIENEIPFVLGE